jgi:hypothetical protein
LDDIAELYFSLLGLDRSGSGDRERVEAALARAYQLRTFEIDLYWKRAAYFWAFQIVIFAAIELLKPRRDQQSGDFLSLSLAVLGIFTSLAGCLSAAGSKFWQKNWESHIDMLEEQFEGHLHKTVWTDYGDLSYSVSKVNGKLTIYFLGFWVAIFSYTAWKTIGEPRFPVPFFFRQLSTQCIEAAGFGLVALVGVAGLYFAKTDRMQFASVEPPHDEYLWTKLMRLIRSKRQYVRKFPLKRRRPDDY